MSERVFDCGSVADPHLSGEAMEGRFWGQTHELGLEHRRVATDGGEDIRKSAGRVILDVSRDLGHSSVLKPNADRPH